MSAVGITENVKGDNKKFEVWYNSREVVYIIQAPSMDVKNMWVSEIRKVLTGQLEACRGTHTHTPFPKHIDRLSVRQSVQHTEGGFPVSLEWSCG
ncbi:guanine nucleotide exchange factor DBS isoform X1 [Lates japonicus]|uniref:Guanine nucleotide exchange factor DBS isoform X1 n=1 Tax=Lates japonicus TaxID=270547 RepID=A0AAD3MF55_LATJO|nr:guanine nucleotide exchange factor DBS isoform X1 [Lates japonicus]